jgi:WD40 repeat protein
LVVGFILMFLLVACQQDQEEVPDGAPPATIHTSFTGAVPPGAQSRLGRGSLNVVAFSPGGEHLAAGGDVGLYLYDAETLEEIWQLPTTSPIIAISFSPQGDILATGARNGSLSLIDGVDGQVLTSTPGNDSDQIGVNTLAWVEGNAPEGQLNLAAGFNDGNVAISRIDLGEADQASGLFNVEVLGTLDRQATGVTSMAYNPNGKVLATGNRGGVINLWDAETMQWFGALEEHEQDNAVQALVWSPDSKRLISSSLDDSVIVWDVLTFQPLDRLAHGDDAINVGYSPDGEQFASAGVDGEVNLWESEDPQENQAAVMVGHELTAIAWSPKWDKFVTVLPEGELAVWSMDEMAENAQPLAILAGHSMHGDWVSSGAWSPGGDKLATGLGDDVLIWDSDSGELENTLEGHSSLVTSAAWSADGDQLATGSRDQSVIIWDLESGRPRLTLAEHGNNVTDLAWSPDGRRLASAGSLDDTVIVWDPETGEVVHKLPGTGSGVWSLAWSPDGDTLAVGTTLGEILFWDMTGQLSGGPFKNLKKHTNWIAGLDYSPDGKLLASAGADNRIILTDLEDDSAKNYVGHLGPVRRVRFSPDGDRLASASRDGLVVVWDAARDAGTEPIAILEGHTDGVNEVFWSPDGKLLASGSDDGTVIIWDVTP